MRNPFVIQRDIVYGEPFCDRENEIERFLSAVRMGESLCLISPRRYGKTSLLNQIAGKLEETNWLTAKIDLMKIFSDRELAREIERTRIALMSRWKQVAQKVGKALKRFKRPTIELEYEDIRLSLGLGHPEVPEGKALLRESLERLCALPEETGLPVFVYFDEFQRIREIDPKGHLEALFRSVFQGRTHEFLPVYLGSRRHMLKMIFADEGAPFFKSATILNLGTIHHDSFVSFVRNQFKKTLKITFPKGLAFGICNFFDGHPHLLNKTAANIWDMYVRNGQKADGDVLRAACKESLLNVIREETETYIESNQKTPFNQISVLRQIGLMGLVPKPYSREFLKNCDVSQSQMQKILAALIEDDRVVKDNRGIYVEDPFERLALKMMGTSQEQRSSIIDAFLKRVG